MIELECPNCGGYGAIPKEKAHTRMVCKKCNFVFHLDPTGRAKAGEPPVDNSARHKGDRTVPAASHRVALEDMPSFDFSATARSKLLLGVLGVIVLGAVAYLISSRGGESLGELTTRTADAFASANLGAIKPLATAGSEDDLVKAYEEVHKDLELLKKETTTQELLVSTIVVDENRPQRTGASSAFFAPKSGRTRDEAISSQAGATPLKKRAVEVNFPWSLDSSGRWRLDGHRLLQSVGSGQ
jgi:hypothetical protein